MLIALCVSLLFAANDAPARDTIHKLSIVDFLANPENSIRLEGVSFYFGDQPHPKVIENLGESRTNKKTNAFNKSDEAACEWVMLSAMLSLHQHAQTIGANAVVNIKSNYKNNVESSDTEYTCGAGALMAGVALIGTFVTIGDGADQEPATPALDVATED
jgi:uncharacterized protein YbjQ (UPF0145 family)